MSGASGSTTAVVERVSLWRLFLVYLKIGVTGFGPALVAETKKHVVNGYKWISEEEFLSGLALAQLLPGATFMSLTVYVGYRIRGVAGALTSFFAFLLPPFATMALLSHAYFTYGSLPKVSILFKGLAIIVAGVVAHAAIEIVKLAVTDYKGAIIAFAAIAVMYYQPNIFLLLLFGAAAGVLSFYRSLASQEAAYIPDQRQLTGAGGIPLKSLAVCTAAVILLIGSIAWQPVLRELVWVFFRMGSFLFGGGYSMLPFIQQEVVTNHGWLTLNEFMVGIALGQVTPGPILITATFIGYKVAGFSGAVAATLGIFLQSLVAVTATAEAHQKIQHSLWVRAAIKGIVAVFAGMVAMVAVGLASNSLIDTSSIIVAVSAFAVLRSRRVDTLWVVAVGALLYWLVVTALF